MTKILTGARRSLLYVFQIPQSNIVIIITTVYLVGTAHAAERDTPLSHHRCIRLHSVLLRDSTRKRMLLARECVVEEEQHGDVKLMIYVREIGVNNFSSEFVK